MGISYRAKHAWEIRSAKRTHIKSGMLPSIRCNVRSTLRREIPLPFQHFNVALFSANYAITEDGGFPASSLKIKINESRTIVKAKLSTIMRYEQKILSKRGIQLVL